MCRFAKSRAETAAFSMVYHTIAAVMPSSQHLSIRTGVGSIHVVADIVEFKAQVSGHEATEKTCRIKAWQHFSDWQLVNRFERNRHVLPLPNSWWSGQHEPEFESAGWWQKPTR